MVADFFVLFLQVRQDWEAWQGTGVTPGRKDRGGSPESVPLLPNLHSVPNCQRASLSPWVWETPCALTKSLWTNRTTITQRRDASPAKSRASTTLLSTPRCTAPACSLTWWRTDTQWPLTFSFTGTGPNRCLYRAALCCTLSQVTRSGSRWLWANTTASTPAPRRTARLVASWCTQTGRTLQCLHNVCPEPNQSPSATIMFSF